LAAATGVLLLLLSASLLWGAPAASTLDWWVIGGGGAQIASSGNTLQGTFGQPLAAPATAAGGNGLCSGFWCNGASPPPGHVVYLPVVMQISP
jgi:hypothetical protein